jgi:uncharacterized protein GlcG (DUF336 family)
MQTAMLTGSRKNSDATRRGARVARPSLPLVWAAVAAATAVAALAACGDSPTVPRNSTSTASLADPAFNRAGHVTMYNRLKAALDQAQDTPNGGFGLNMWGTIVDQSGMVVAVAFTGSKENDQWQGSRVISAQKANTAEDFSLPALALSTANLYSAVQPGGSLFGLQESNPVNTDAAYGGLTSDYGTPNDYMVGKRIGGINVFGGGLALYDHNGNLLGGVGVSGDASCADHNIAWKVRHILQLDFVPAGVDPVVTVTGHTDDNIVYDIDATGKSASGWGHPVCNAATETIGLALPTTYPIRYH